MIRKDFKGKSLPLLGMGCMRFPTFADKSIDEARTFELIDRCLESGVNYFDTAHPYHEGNSEVVLGKVLARHSRDSFFLASKYPGHQISESYDPAAIFEEQLEKCGVDYFDFYLLHNVYENSLGVYLDPQWGILEYFKAQRDAGRIKHLGFSTHAAAPYMETILDAIGDDMEFCQIQLNYLDWTLQDAQRKCELLVERGLPIFVMEPVRGGALASIKSDAQAKLNALRPKSSAASWAFRFLQDIPGVCLILSGMTTMEQLDENVATFASKDPLSPKERAALLEVAEGMKDSLPCTACRYCMDNCPQKLDIPDLLFAYNELRAAPSFLLKMRMEALPKEKQPNACVSCAACVRMCPQGIDIPKELHNFSAALSELPSWAAMCKEREEAARKRREDSLG
ncbi:MAG: aldo/keto reductase [Eggerthellaceae bacterium]|nr:aldo/keto reductase [Eggerthellaceae bacterium]